MKKIVVLAVCVLFSTLVFANGTEDPSKASSVVVLNSSGSNLVKVVYKAPRLGTVKISILNEINEVLFSETFRKMSAFMRPYNFDGLPDGAYTIKIEDEFGKQIEKISFHPGYSSKSIRLAKLAGEEGKVILTGRSSASDEIQVRVYDESRNIVFEENRKVSGQFGQVYNLKNLTGSLTVEVSDGRGVLKSLEF